MHSVIRVLFTGECVRLIVVNGFTNSSDITPIGESVTAWCDTTMARLVGPATVTCGLDGFWEHTPYCEPIQCTPLLVENGMANVTGPVARNQSVQVWLSATIITIIYVCTHNPYHRRRNEAHFMIINCHTPRVQPVNLKLLRSTSENKAGHVRKQFVHCRLRRWSQSRECMLGLRCFPYAHMHFHIFADHLRLRRRATFLGRDCVQHGRPVGHDAAM